ncbi:uncharacterized protein M6B38_287480 [Iris pallida]|uniref:BHLH domain-containing protein n=1 Tax=Iris pallida TaxID=29817 RepID=A0AAX6HZ98_IRIPA|nr:uncharacterized protein M6B38_287480 [Iris pallida]
MKSNGTSSTVDRKTVEKNRRILMKTLCFKLGSLIPKEDRNTENSISQHDHLDQAASYIKKLKARIEELKQRRQRCATAGGGGGSESGKAADGKADEFGLPAVEVRYRDPILEVVLVTRGAAPPGRKKLLFYEVIGVLAEEGAEVVNASFSVVNDRTFLTVHSRAAASTSSEIALDASRISERLKELLDAVSNRT